MTKKVKRLIAGSFVFAALMLLVPMAPAAAKKPTAGCPPAFGGPYDPATVIALFPPPPDFPDPEGALLRFDKNGDGLVCVMGLPKDFNINVIDNVAGTT